MICNLRNPQMIEAARKARRDMYNSARSEDEMLAAAEATVEEFIPLCSCPECTARMEALALELELPL